ncbi:hypothetical protein [Thermomicrobium sp.]
MRATPRAACRSTTAVIVLVAVAWLLAACEGTLVPLVTPTPLAERGATPLPVVLPSPSPAAAPASEASPTAIASSPTAPSQTVTAETTPALQPTVTVRPTPTVASRPAVPAPSTGTLTPTRPVEPGPRETPTPVGTCDLALDKTVAPLTAGTAVVVILTVQQLGTATCPAGALVSDPLPAGFRLQSEVRIVEVGGVGAWQCEGTTCRAGEPLSPGYRATFTFTVSGEAGSAAENCALVAVENDADPANDASCVTLGPFPTAPVTPTPPPVACLFGFEKAIRLGEPNTGGQARSATMTIRIRNAGPEECAVRWPEFVVADLLPTGMSLSGAVRLNAAAWSCRASERAFQCSGPPPQPGSEVIVTVEVVVAAEAERAVNCATLDPVGAQACAVPTLSRG